jgi:hypothetical protein
MTCAFIPSFEMPRIFICPLIITDANAIQELFPY